MNNMIFGILLIPFLGTSLGSACVFFMKKKLSFTTEKILSGFAAGVMVAASIWSLLIPAMKQEAAEGVLSFVPAVLGFWLGTFFLLALDRLIPHLHLHSEEPEGLKTNLQQTTMMVLAVIIHNIPEGMAVGVVLAGWIQGNAYIALGSVLALAIGIAIQNFPEGAIISLPLHAKGETRWKAFTDGVLSGAVEPILGGIITLLLTKMIVPMMPYLLGFAAGAMLYVVVEELVPEMAEGKHSNIGVIFFAIGFTLMLALDIALG